MAGGSTRAGKLVAGAPPQLRVLLAMVILGVDHPRGQNRLGPPTGGIRVGGMEGEEVGEEVAAGGSPPPPGGGYSQNHELYVPEESAYTRGGAGCQVPPS